MIKAYKRYMLKRELRNRIFTLLWWIYLDYMVRIPEASASNHVFADHFFANHIKSLHKNIRDMLRYYRMLRRLEGRTLPRPN